MSFFTKMAVFSGVILLFASYGTKSFLGTIVTIIFYVLLFLYLNYAAHEILTKIILILPIIGALAMGNIALFRLVEDDGTMPLYGMVGFAGAIFDFYIVGHIFLKIYAPIKKARDENLNEKTERYRHTFIKQMENDVFQYSMAIQDIQKMVNKYSRTNNFINLVNSCDESISIKQIYLSKCEKMLNSDIDKLRRKYKNMDFPVTIDGLNDACYELRKKINNSNDLKKEAENYDLKEIKSLMNAHTKM